VAMESVTDNRIGSLVAVDLNPAARKYWSRHGSIGLKVHRVPTRSSLETTSTLMEGGVHRPHGNALPIRRAGHGRLRTAVVAAADGRLDQNTGSELERIDIAAAAGAPGKHAPASAMTIARTPDGRPAVVPGVRPL
jgi:hypothetical protein